MNWPVFAVIVAVVLFVMLNKILDSLDRIHVTLHHINKVVSGGD
jgi:hypothetical protein